MSLRCRQICEMLNSPQHILSGLASNYPQGYTPQGTQHIPYSTASGYHHTILGAAGRFDSTMMQQGAGAAAGFGMVARAALMPTPTNQHAGVNGSGGHHPPPHPHHPVSLGLEVRCNILMFVDTNYRAFQIFRGSYIY